MRYIIGDYMFKILIDPGFCMPTFFLLNTASVQGGDMLFKSRNIDFQEPMKSNKFDKKSGEYETTPTVDGNTFDRLHLKVKCQI